MHDARNVHGAQVDIGHDGKWPLSGWHLNKVMVQNLSTNDSTFFHHNQWLDSKQGRRVALLAGTGTNTEHEYQVSSQSCVIVSRALQ